MYVKASNVHSSLRSRLESHRTRWRNVSVPSRIYAKADLFVIGVVLGFARSLCTQKILLIHLCSSMHTQSENICFVEQIRSFSSLYIDEVVVKRQRNRVC